jgi:hypothetical protein
MFPKYIQVPITPTVARALREMAWREERDPRVQAARILRERLIREGVLIVSEAAPAPPAIAVPD